MFHISVLSCFPCEQAALCKYQILLTRIDTASQVGVQVIQSESPTLTSAFTCVNRPRRQFEEGCDRLNDRKGLELRKCCIFNDLLTSVKESILTEEGCVRGAGILAAKDAAFSCLSATRFPTAICRPQCLPTGTAFLGSSPEPLVDVAAIP